MSDLRIEKLSKSFGEKQVLRDLTLTIPEGEVTSLLGASGSGKTTLLRILAGLEKRDSGEISGLPKAISYVFQEDRLCEEFSAVSNLHFAVGKRKTKQELRELLSKLGLSESMERPVKELSGGMKRRVAIARALICEYELLLLDEPFKGLDASLKQEVMDVVKRRSAGKTVLLVTHDTSEAEYFGGKTVTFS